MTPPRGARLAFLVVSPLVFFAALLTARRVLEAPGDPEGFWDDSLRREVQAIVERRYVDRIGEAEARRLFQSALQGYVSRLDPFSRFVPPEEKSQLDEEVHGVFGGIGVRWIPIPGGLRVTAVRETSPAARAGIRPEDVVELVGGEPLSGRDREQMISMIRGPAGTTVELTVRRGEERRTFTVERAEIPVDTVTSVRTFPGAAGAGPVGYVRIEQFSDTTPAEVREAFGRLSGERVSGFVIDLRQNLGGVVEAAVRVASLLLPDATTVCVARRREAGDVRATRAWEDFAPLDAPLTVLVDDSTASASEILAGALQDHGRALVLGQRTWGKFLVQTLVPASDGSTVKITTARYETPRGRSAPRDEDDGPAGGLMPDVRVPIRDADERDALLRSLAGQSGPHWIAAPREGREPDDRALDAALALLRGEGPPGEPVAAR